MKSFYACNLWLYECHFLANHTTVSMCPLFWEVQEATFEMISCVLCKLHSFMFKWKLLELIFWTFLIKLSLVVLVFFLVVFISTKWWHPLFSTWIDLFSCCSFFSFATNFAKAIRAGLFSLNTIQWTQFLVSDGQLNLLVFSIYISSTHKWISAFIGRLKFQYAFKIISRCLFVGSIRENLFVFPLRMCFFGKVVAAGIVVGLDQWFVGKEWVRINSSVYCQQI